MKSESDVFHCDPATLRPHDLRDLLNPIRSRVEHDESLCASVAEIGVLQPILLADDGRVLDGMRRIEAAMRAGHAEIACMTAPAGQELIALTTATFTRVHYTRSQIAYLVWPLVEPLMAEAREFAKNNLLRGDIPVGTRCADGKPLSRDRLCAQFSVGRNELREAGLLHQFLAGEAADGEYRRICPKKALEDARRVVEASLFEAGTSIRKWRVVVAGSRSTRSDLHGAAEQQSVFDFEPLSKCAATFVQRWGKREAWQGELKDESMRRLQDSWAELPPEVTDGMFQVLREIEKTRSTIRSVK